MDSLIAASARALAGGDPLSALKRIALRDDPPALALRGIAMAQLGDYTVARDLLKRATRGFGADEGLAKARCVVAEAEVALARRDFGGSTRALAAAAAALEAYGDHGNAMQARLVAVRRLLLLGRLDQAASERSALDLNGTSAALVAVAELITAELALRSLQIAAARTALARAHQAAVQARVPPLTADVEHARAAMDCTAARRLDSAGEHALRLDEVATLLSSGALVVDACRRAIGVDDTWVALARRPVLFELARALAQAWPAAVDREALIASAFRTHRPDETHRARLRVEIGRLRTLAKELTDVEATARGFVLRPHRCRTVVLLAAPVDGQQGALLALLSDGAAWSTPALALALGASQRTVQRALAELEAAQRVRGIGQARARRWLSPPLTGITTVLLLPAPLQSGYSASTARHG